MKETAERLMDLAEAHIRNAGYAGFSFRDIAAEIGIKSASVHHHFPTKATMAAAVARRYADRFFAAVARRPNETADVGPPPDPLNDRDSRKLIRAIDQSKPRRVKTRRRTRALNCSIVRIVNCSAR